MASVEELTKKLEELEHQLKEESAKTVAVENEVKELRNEVVSLKESKSRSRSDKKKSSSSSRRSHKKSKKEKKEGKETKKEEPNEVSKKEDVAKVTLLEGNSSSDDEGKTVMKPETPKKRSEMDSSSEDDKPSNKSEASQEQDGKPVVKGGWLEKKGAIRHNWLKRWFELDSNEKFLYYYDKKGDAQAKGVIPLTNATCYAHVEKKGVVKPLFFNIRTETRDFLIRAETPEEKGDWVKAIKSQCVKGTLSPEAKKHLQRKASSFIGRTTEDEHKK